MPVPAPVPVPTGPGTGSGTDQWFGTGDWSMVSLQLGAIRRCFSAHTTSPEWGPRVRASRRLTMAGEDRPEFARLGDPVVVAAIPNTHAVGLRHKLAVFMARLDLPQALPSFRRHNRRLWKRRWAGRRR